ncbi:hypothetical protein T265_15613, partial [Opisthorchis viverrini]
MSVARTTPSELTGRPAKKLKKLVEFSPSDFSADYLKIRLPANLQCYQIACEVLWAENPNGTPTMQLNEAFSIGSEDCKQLVKTYPNIACVSQLLHCSEDCKQLVKTYPNIACVSQLPHC